MTTEARTWTRVATLLVLSPIVGELMSGATRLSYIFVLVPEIMVWGTGTLIIREFVRRWKAGVTSTLLLGFGLAIAEEFIIQQTSLAPLPFLGAAPGFGRVWGVNWPYFAFMLVYEAVWIVVVPIQITELVFPGHRREPWIRTRGLVIASIVFVLGSFIAWFSWTQQARPNVFHVPVYHPPTVTLIAGALAIVLLGAAGHAVRGSSETSQRTVPSPWVMTLSALLLGFPWYGLMAVIFSPKPLAPLWVVLAAAFAWATAAFALIQRWAHSARAGERHWWALCFGALVVCMLAGFLGASAWSRSDVIAKILFNVAAVAGMMALRTRIVRRDRARAPSEPRGLGDAPQME